MVRLPLRLVPSRLVVTVLTGELAGAKWITDAGTHGCWIGTYERETQQIFARFIRQGDVVCDIGANVGFFTLLASRLVGPNGAVWSFEPVPRNLTYLRRHIDANGISNVHVVEAAVAARSGNARFSTATSPSMGHLDDQGELVVPAVSLDDLVNSGEVRPPRFLKIDVEGAEADVLLGAEETLRRLHPVILLSNHGYARHQQCCSYLRDLGYAIETVRDGRDDGQYTVLATHLSEGSGT